MNLNSIWIRHLLFCYRPDAYQRLIQSDKWGQHTAATFFIAINNGNPVFAIIKWNFRSSIFKKTLIRMKRDIHRVKYELNYFSIWNIRIEYNYTMLTIILVTKDLQNPPKYTETPFCITNRSFSSPRRNNHDYRELQPAIQSFTRATPVSLGSRNTWTSRASLSSLETEQHQNAALLNQHDTRRLTPIPRYLDENQPRRKRRARFGNGTVKRKRTIASPWRGGYRDQWRRIASDIGGIFSPGSIFRSRPCMRWPRNFVDARMLRSRRTESAGGGVQR